MSLVAPLDRCELPDANDNVVPITDEGEALFIDTLIVGETTLVVASDEERFEGARRRHRVEVIF